MLKTGLFIQAIGFVLLIAGVVSKSDQRLWTLLLSVVFIGGGFYLYSRGEKDKNPPL